MRASYGPRGYDRATPIEEDALLTIYDAARCPYCARVRIVLAEKGIDHELVIVDLDDRPGLHRSS